MVYITTLFYITSCLKAKKWRKVMNQKTRKKILAILLLISLLLGIFEPVTKNNMLAKKKQDVIADGVEISEEVWEEREGERTANSTTYERTDGMKKTIFSSDAIRFLDKKKLIDYDGSLKTIDSNKSEQGTSLKQYTYENKAGDKKHYFPKKLTSNTPLLMEYQDYSLSLLSCDEEGQAISSEDIQTKKNNIEDFYGTAEEKITSAIYSFEDGISVQ